MNSPLLFITTTTTSSSNKVELARPFLSFPSRLQPAIRYQALRFLFIVDVRRVSVPHFRFALVEKSKTERTRAERKQLTRKHGDRLHLSDVRFQLWQSARFGTASCRSAETVERANDPPVFSLAHENTPNQSPVKQVKPPASKSVCSSPLYAKPVVRSIASSSSVLSSMFSSSSKRLFRLWSNHLRRWPLRRLVHRRTRATIDDIRVNRVRSPRTVWRPISITVKRLTENRSSSLNVPTVTTQVNIQARWRNIWPMNILLNKHRSVKTRDSEGIESIVVYSQLIHLFNPIEQQHPVAIRWRWRRMRMRVSPLWPPDSLIVRSVHLLRWIPKNSVNMSWPIIWAIRTFVVWSVIDSIDIEATVGLPFACSTMMIDKHVSLSLGSFHIRKKHSDRMIGDNVDSLREYVGEFHPNSMSAVELKELLSCPSAPSLASIPSNGLSTNVRSQPVSVLTAQQPNPAHSFRCGYCKFSSVNSGDVKKHQTWKHAHLASNILPIDPTDPQQQPMMSYKRKRVQSTRLNQQEDEEPNARRQRVSMPSQRHLTIDPAPSNGDTDAAPRG